MANFQVGTGIWRIMTDRPVWKHGRALFQEIPFTKRTSRLHDLDAARGLAIALVVIGHIVAGNGVSGGGMPRGNDWYVVLMKTIYQFHMPFFMVLSGITFALSLPAFHSMNEVRAYSIRRVGPLIVPYVALGLLVLLGKQVAIHFLHVDNVPGGFASSLLMLLFVPTESVARFLWFIYVLSMYFVVVPPLFYAIGRRPGLLLIGGVALQFFNWPPVLAIQRAIEYLPFFAIGMVLWTYRTAWTPVTKWVFWPSTFTFVGLLFLSNYFPVPRWLVGVSSIAPVMGLVQRIPSAFQLFLGYLGQNSLSIYLFNVLVIGLVKGLLFLVLPWDGINFVLYFVLLTISGIGVPLAIKAASLKWFPHAAKYV